MSNRIKRFMIRLPSKILDLIDELIREGMFSDRQDFIKDASRRYLTTLGMIQTNIEAPEDAD